MSSLRIAAVTGDGVAVVDGVPHAPAAQLTLEGSGAQCIAADPRDPDRIFAGTFDRGLFRTRDGGASWEAAGDGIPHPRVLSVSVSPCELDGDLPVVYAGTEPSALFRTSDDGRNWRELTAMQELPSRSTWSFPPRPWTHHVRWIAPHHSMPETLFVGIELGGVLRTLDGGVTWQDRHPQAVIDPHVLCTHPVSTDRAYGVGGDGISFSVDAGETWERDIAGMDRTYTWGLAVDPQDPDLWYSSAAPDPGRAHGEGDPRARLYRKRGRAPWEALEIDGLGGTTRPLAKMPYSLLTFRDRPGVLLAGMRDGSLVYSDDAGDTWQPLEVRLPGILAITDATR